MFRGVALALALAIAVAELVQQGKFALTLSTTDPNQELQTTETTPSVETTTPEAAAVPGEAPKKLQPSDGFASDAPPTEPGTPPPVAGVHTQSQAATQVPSKIDLVYTWVDPSDPKWLDSKMQVEAELQGSTDFAPAADSNKNHRFRDHQELKFSLRSVEKYAKWVNHIYIVVCCNQRPSWLADSDMVTMVQHETIFSKPVENLPTFSSLAIETGVDRIPGLSEHFLMLNDDMMFASTVNPSDFFTKEGKPIIGFQTNWGGVWDEDERDKRLKKGIKPDAYKLAMCNINRILTKRFGSETRYNVLHQAYPVTKSLYSRARELEPDAFALTEFHKFRDDSDIIPAPLAMYIGIYEQNAEKTDSPPSNIVVTVTDNVEESKKKLDGIPPDTRLLCVGDKSEQNAEIVGELLQTTLQKMFPDKSKFEVVE